MPTKCEIDGHTYCVKDTIYFKKEVSPTYIYYSALTGYTCNKCLKEVFSRKGTIILKTSPAPTWYKGQ